MKRSIRYRLSDGERVWTAERCESASAQEPNTDHLGSDPSSVVLKSVRMALAEGSRSQDLALTAVIRRLRDRRTSPGLIILENLPRPADPRYLIALMGELLGKVQHYEGEGDSIIEIKEQAAKPGERPSFKNSREFYFHTDLSYIATPPDFLFMHAVVNNEGEGGISLFADVERATVDLSATSVAELQRPQFIFPAPSHYKGGGSVQFPILTQEPNTNAWLIRFRRDSLRAETRAGMEAVTELVAALNRVSEETLLATDALVLIDNRTFLHGRTAFLGASSAAHPRHLNRLYVDVSKSHDEPLN